ncbi:hypothetical protein K3495_g3324 [Podosphaera aphanis]|nr:hypothetical protein K3495_g3324 [Podosphaera aphanis]
MGHIRTCYFEDSDPASHTQQKAIPHFVTDNIESNMIHFSYQSDEGSEMPQVGGDAYMGGLAEVKDRERRELHDCIHLQDESGGDSNIGPSIKNYITKRGGTKLRTIVGRERKGTLDYKKMLEDTKITMSMMDFYQASPDFSKSCRKFSTRINDKRAGRKKVPQPASEPMPGEEILMAETSVAPAKTRSNIKPAFDTLKKRSTFICNSASADKILKDRVFRVPGEVFSMKDGKSGRTHLNASIVCADQGSDLVLISPQLVRILNLKKNTFTNTNGQATIMEGFTAMSKRDFFSIFWEAFEKAFTEKKNNSAWEKTGIWPFCPSMVLKTFDQPKDLKRNRNDLSDEFNSPLENQKLRTLVSSASARTDAATRYLLGQLSNRILEGDAQQTVLLMENVRLKEALNKANAEKKRKKTTIEHFRAEDGSGAVFLDHLKYSAMMSLISKKTRRKSRRARKNYVNKRTIRVAAAEARKKAAAEKKAALASAREAKVQYEKLK